jgi:radical SAM-linked protein
VEPGSAPGPEAIAEPQAIPRQRWRLVLERLGDAPALAGRELIDAWEQAIETTGLPLHRPGGRSRARVALGAPLPLGMAAERELAEIVLTEMLPVWRVRAALVGGLPAGWRLVDVYDVWVGSPALAGRVSGAQYRLVVDGPADPGAIAAAAAALLQAGRLPRARIKGDSQVAYDLRPLLVDVGLTEPGPPVVLRIRTKIHPELGTGRPQEVLAALADQLGRPLAAASITRERLILAGDPD